MSDFKVNLTLTADGKVLVRTVADADKAMEKLGPTAQRSGAQTTESMEKAARSTARVRSEAESAASQIAKLGVAGLGLAGLKAYVSAIVEASNATAGYDFGLKAATGSASAAVAAMAFIRAESNRLGTDLRSSAQAFTALAAAAKGTSLEGEGARKIFSAVSEASRVLHLSTEQTAGALNAIQQMMSKGNVQAEELRGQLGERLPGAFNLAAQAMGVTTAQLNKMLDDGKVLAADLLPKLADQLHKVYGAQAEAAAQSPAAALVRLKNAVFDLEAAIGKAGVMDALALGANALTISLQTLVPLLPTLIGGLTTLSAVVTANYVAGWVKAAITTAAAKSALVERAAMELRAAQAAEVEAAAELTKVRALELGIGATGRATAAEAALASAQLRTAAAMEASAAASVASTGAMARLGGGALALVGGPVGALLIALGALAAAIYSSIKAEQERIATFNTGIANLEAATKATRELIAARAQLHGQPQSLGEVVKQEATNTELLVAKTKDLQDAKSRLRDLAEESARVQARASFGETAAYASAKAEVAKLTAEMDRLRAATSDLTAEMRARLLAFLKDDLPNASRDARVALGSVFSSFKKGDVLGAVGEAADGVGQALAGLRARFLDADKAGVAAFDGLKTSLKSAVDEGAKIGKTEADIAKSTAAAAVAALEHAHASAEEIDAARKVGDQLIKQAQANLEAKDALKHHTDASKELRREQTQAAEAARELFDAWKTLDDQLDSLRAKESPAAQAQAEFDKGMRSLQANAEKVAIAEGDVADVITKWQAGEELLQQQLDDTNKELAERGDVLGTYLKQLRGETATVGLTAREKAIALAVDQVTAAWKKNSDAGVKNAQSLKTVVDGAREAAGAAFDLSQNASIVEDFISQFGDLSEFDKLTDGIDRVGQALDKAIGDGATQKVKELQRTLGNLRQSMVEGIVQTSQNGLRSIQSMTTEGSRAFQAMQIAIDALSVVQAISAVLNQGQGDPYTAFARMAAMAAAVASLGVSIHGFRDSSLTDSSKQNQATQGTGSVLGDSAAKSESIAKATEITANATQQLVGLNRGMLNALKALESALGSAGGLLARGAGEADFSGMNLAAKPFDFKDPLTNWLLGGNSKVTDQGIMIFGGALNDLLQHVAVGAYQEVKSKSWAFGSTKTKTGVQDVSDEFEKQFGLVMQSIADTVREGAKALGLLPADIEAAMAAFRVEEVKISLKGLSAEDQQKEIQAVFSKIFDGLAGSVVPFIDQFQKVGEGLGETLVRIATEVQVTQQAFKQLGFAIDATDPEKFAQISDALIQATGGMDAFISGMQSFTENFAPEEHKFQVAADALASAFDQVGLVVPETRDGMWALMQSLDATTEAGREQIATLLRLADTANQYYDLLDKRSNGTVDAVRAYAAMVQDLDQQLAALNGRGISDFQKALGEIGTTELKAIDALNAAAKAAGLQAAREEDLSKIHQIAAARAAAAMRELDATSIDIVSRLRGSNGLNTAAQSASSALGTVSAGLGALADAANKFRDDMLLDPQLSPLNTQQQFDEAMRQLAKTGDADIGRRALELAQRLTASGADYRALFDQITAMVHPSAASAGDTSSAYDASAAASSQDIMSPAEKAALAQQLAQNVADAAGFTGDDFSTILTRWGYSLDQLGTDLGLQGESLQDYLTSLEADSYTLTDLSTLVERQVDRIVEAIRGEKTPTSGGDEPGKEVGEKVEQSGQAIATVVASVGTEQTGELRVVSDELRQLRGDIRGVFDLLVGGGANLRTRELN